MIREASSATRSMRISDVKGLLASVPAVIVEWIASRHGGRRSSQVGTVALDLKSSARPVWSCTRGVGWSGWQFSALGRHRRGGGRDRPEAARPPGSRVADGAAGGFNAVQKLLTKLSQGSESRQRSASTLASTLTAAWQPCPPTGDPRQLLATRARYCRTSTGAHAGDCGSCGIAFEGGQSGGSVIECYNSPCAVRACGCGWPTAGHRWCPGHRNDWVAGKCGWAGRRIDRGGPGWTRCSSRCSNVAR
jgi:hypothetical protein